MTIDGKHNLSLVLFCKQVEASPALNVQYWAYLELGAVCSFSGSFLHRFAFAGALS
jgi:hypothetical protein